MFNDPKILILAFLGGVTPALLWLWFWLKEDKLHPEPRGLLILSFMVGMLATALAFPIEYFVVQHVPHNNLTLLSFWAVIEETLKFVGINRPRLQGLKQMKQQLQLKKKQNLRLFLKKLVQIKLLQLKLFAKLFQHLDLVMQKNLLKVYQQLLLKMHQKMMLKKQKK